MVRMDMAPIPVRLLLSMAHFNERMIFAVALAEIDAIGAIFVVIPIVVVLVAAVVIPDVVVAAVAVLRISC